MVIITHIIVGPQWFTIKPVVRLSQECLDRIPSYTLDLFHIEEHLFRTELFEQTMD